MALEDFDKPRLTIEFEDTGEFVSTGIVSYSITSSFFQSADAWEFEVANPEDPASLRDQFRPWRPLRLYVDGNLQVIGRIDANRGNPGNSNLSVLGSDYLADLVDPTVDPTYKIKEGMSLGEAVLGALKPFGIKTVFGTNLNRNILTGAQPFVAPPPRDFKAAKVSDFNPGENDGALEWATRVVARHGFTLQPAGTRDSLLIIAPSYDQSPLYTLRRPGNVVAGFASRDWSDVPTLTIATGRGVNSNGSRGALKAEIPTFNGNPLFAVINAAKEVQRVVKDAAGVPTVRSRRYDPDNPNSGGPFAHSAPVYKPLFYTDKDSKTLEQIEAGVRRQISDRLIRTLQYTATMQGTRDHNSGATYAIDTVAQVFDGIENIDEQLWVSERTFMFQPGSGSATRLNLIRRGSYVL